MPSHVVEDQVDVGRNRGIGHAAGDAGRVGVQAVERRSVDVADVNARARLVERAGDGRADAAGSGRDQDAKIGRRTKRIQDWHGVLAAHLRVDGASRSGAIDECEVSLQRGAGPMSNAHTAVADSM